MDAEFNDYLPVLITILLALGFAGGMIFLSSLVGKKAPGNPAKDTPYESGMPIITEAHTRFSVKFYIVAMLFILFDIEVVFLYPWAVVFSAGEPGLGLALVFGEMLVFIAVLFVGWLFIVKKGVLGWQRAE